MTTNHTNKNTTGKSHNSNTNYPNQHPQKFQVKILDIQNITETKKYHQYKSNHRNVDRHQKNYQRRKLKSHIL